MIRDGSKVYVLLLNLSFRVVWLKEKLIKLTGQMAQNVCEGDVSNEDHDEEKDKDNEW